MLQKPRIGADVHFYNDHNQAHDHNGTGQGPYAAKIVQIHGDPENPNVCVSLTVFPPFGAPYSEGSVTMVGSRRYEWPPRA